MWKATIVSLGLALIGGAALAADIYVPPPPPPPPSATAKSDIRGDIDAYIGFARSVWSAPEPYDGGPVSEWFFGGSGRLNVPFGQMLNLELEAVGLSEHFSATGGVPTWTSAWDALVVAHLYWRDPQSFAFGIFGGPQWQGERSNSGSGSLSGYLIGGEAQAYLGQAILYAQAFYSGCNNCLWTGTSWAVRGNGQFFFNPRTSLAFDVQYIASTHSPTFSDLTLALTGMAQLGSAPIALFVQGRYDHLSLASSYATANRWAGLIGLRLLVGPRGTDLWTNATKGPAMNVLPVPIIPEVYVLR